MQQQAALLDKATLAQVQKLFNVRGGVVGFARVVGLWAGVTGCRLTLLCCNVCVVWGGPQDLVMTRTTGSQTRRVSVELWGSGTTITAPTGAAAATAIPDATAFAQGLPKWQ